MRRHHVKTAGVRTRVCAETLENRILLAVEPAGFRLFTDADLSTSGLVGSYVNQDLRSYSTQNDWRVSQKVAGTRVDRTLNFTKPGWGQRAEVKLTGGTDDDWDNFSVQWDGYLQVTMDKLPLATRSDDSSRMWIDINGDGKFNTSGTEFINNHWGSMQGATMGPASAPLARGVYQIRIQYEEGVSENSMQLVTALPMVRAAYVVPSNRTAQPRAVEAIQNYLKLAQDWYRDQMERNGFGAKTFTVETEDDGVTPKVHVVNVAETDDYMREDMWGHVMEAAGNAGVPLWNEGQVWYLMPEAHLENPDGSIDGGVALGGSWGSGIDGGVGMIGSNAIPVMLPEALTDNRTYAGKIVPEIGPYPLVQDKSYAWFEGTTFSQLAGTYLGAAAHEMSHAFGLPHDMRNDENMHGNMMGNGLRGFRGAVYPELYPNDDMYLSYGQAMLLSTSRYFNPGAFPTDRTQPTLTVSTSGSVAPVNGLLPIRFTVSDTQGLSSATLVRNGEQIDEMKLSGTSATKTFTTALYTPGTEDSYDVAVFDVLGNKSSVGVKITPSATANRAVQPFVRLNSTTIFLGKSLTLNASNSTDPDGNFAMAKVEWDLDGDGVFDTTPSTSKSLSRTMKQAGVWRIQARFTDAGGAVSLSEPVGIRVVPTLTGNSGSSSYCVRANPEDPNQLQIYQYSTPVGDPAYTMMRTDSRALIFNAKEGGDQLAVDFSNGDAVPVNGLVFDGGTGVDTFTVRVTACEGIVAEDEQVKVGGSVIKIAGVEKQMFDVGTLTAGPTTPTTLTRGGNKVLRVGVLAIQAGGVLDLGDTGMVFASPDAKPEDSVKVLGALIRSGRGDGSWAGLGITSSAAAADTRQMHGLAAVVNLRTDGKGPLYDNLFGMYAATSDVLVKYTWNGDANLDGIISADDYFLADSGYVTQKGGWGNGDFNYDGVVNADDYFMIDSAYVGQQVEEPGSDAMVVKAAETKVEYEGVLAELFSTEAVL